MLAPDGPSDQAIVAELVRRLGGRVVISWDDLDDPPAALIVTTTGDADVVGAFTVTLEIAPHANRRP